MNKSTEEKSLTVIKETSIFGRIRKFFQNIFGGKKQKYQYIEENFTSNQNEQKHNFMALDNIEIKFQNFREGLIREKDLTKEEKEKMTKMFQERIEIEEQEINRLKKEIIKLRAEYLKTN